MIRVRLGISALCALDHFHLYNRPDAVLGHAGFLSAPLTHLLSSAINPEEATSSAPVGEAFQLQVHAGAVSL